MNEFDVIQQFFTRQAKNPEIKLSVGDDCCAIAAPQDQLLLSSTDTLVLGSHFYSDMPAEDLAYKALAVSVSDVLAMAAKPVAVLLSLTLPDIDEDWLQDFSQGFYELADAQGVDLVGGNMTKGPLSITTTVQGLVAEQQLLKRSTAQVGDKLFVAAELGAAAGAYQLRKQQFEFDALKQAWYRPRLRAELLAPLREFASAGIDLSDGLLADVGHLAKASGVGIAIDSKKVPVASALHEYFSEQQALQLALSGGEDYQLCFTAPASAQTILEREHACFCVGDVIADREILLDGQSIQTVGFQHF